jgi:hypothetical protein
MELIFSQARQPQGETRSARPRRAAFTLMGTPWMRRQNLTSRMQIRGLTRLPNAFSKKRDASLSRSTILPGSSQGAVITDRVWNLAEILAQG